MTARAGRLGLVTLGGIVALLAACSDDEPTDQPVPKVPAAGASAALTCEPLAVRPCPCLNGGMGTQACVATGNAYGPCGDCPPASAAPGAAGNGSQPGMTDAGTDSATPATDAGGNSSDGSTAKADAETDPLGLSPAGTAPGTSCGVGLPVLCALEAEKCCARSLETDTCIGASESCTCDLQGCSVMEAHCDGPEDCPDGQVCCGTLAGGAGYERFECTASCDYGGTQRIACHQDQPECPSGTECANSQLLTNVQVCIDPATIRQ